MKNLRTAFSVLILLLAAFTVSAQVTRQAIPHSGRLATTPAGGCIFKGQTYYDTATDHYRKCTVVGSPGTWVDMDSAGSSGITVGTTTSDGAANTLLKTDGSGKVNNATGVAQPTGGTLKLTSQNATDVVLTGVSATSQSGDIVDFFRSDGTTKHFWITAPSTTNGPEMHLKEAGFSNELVFSIDNSSQSNISSPNNGKIIAIGGRPNTGQGKLLIQAREDDTGGKAIEIRTQAADTVGETISLAASQSANAVNVTSSGGSAGDLYSISPGGFTKSAGDKTVASNATNATATMSNLTDLTLTLEASGKYRGTFSFLAKNSTAGEGIAIDFNGGAATVTSVQFGFTCTPPGVTLGTTNSAALATAITATTATTTDVWYTVNFIVTVNAAGTIIPRFSEVSHTSGTATVEAGSYSNVRKY
jgi:hypothetical protein